MSIECPDCHRGKLVPRESKYGKFLGCTNYPYCTGSHSIAPDGSPLGIPADRKTKRWRRRAHEAFDGLSKHMDWTRTEAYTWLQQQLELSAHDCHISRFDRAMCLKVIDAVDAFEDTDTEPAQGVLWRLDARDEAPD